MKTKNTYKKINGVKYIVLFGKKVKDNFGQYCTALFKDRELRDLKAVDVWHAHRKSKIITFNCFSYWLEVVK